MQHKTKLGSTGKVGQETTGSVAVLFVWRQPQLSVTFQGLSLPCIDPEAEGVNSRCKRWFACSNIPFCGGDGKSNTFCFQATHPRGTSWRRRCRCTWSAAGRRVPWTAPGRAAAAPARGAAPCAVRQLSSTKPSSNLIIDEAPFPGLFFIAPKTFCSFFFSSTVFQLTQNCKLREYLNWAPMLEPSVDVSATIDHFHCGWQLPLWNGPPDSWINQTTMDYAHGCSRFDLGLHWKPPVLMILGSSVFRSNWLHRNRKWSPMSTLITAHSHCPLSGFQEALCINGRTGDQPVSERNIRWRAVRCWFCAQSGQAAFLRSARRQEQLSHRQRAPSCGAETSSTRQSTKTRNAW